MTAIAKNNVFRLDISMKDATSCVRMALVVVWCDVPARMAIVRGVKNLGENVLDKSVLSEVSSTVDTIPEVAVAVELHDDELIFSFRERLVQGDDAVTITDTLMKLEFPALAEETAFIGSGP